MQRLYKSFRNMADREMTYNIYDMAGEYATTADQGQKVYDKIHPELVAGNAVKLDFTGVKVFASPFFNFAIGQLLKDIFFNFAIGQLLKDIAADNLNRLVSIDNLNAHGQTVLERVIANAKQYYSDPIYQQAVDAVLEEYAADS